MYLETDPYSDAVESLRFTAEMAPGTVTDLFAWRWVAVGLHGGLQTLMTVALKDGGHSLSPLSDRSSKDWLKAYEGDGRYPPPFLDTFLGLYAKIKRADSFHVVGAVAFPAQDCYDGALSALNEVRNDFTHFSVDSIIVHIPSFRRHCLLALDVADHLIDAAQAVVWRCRGQAEAAHDHLRTIRAALSQGDTVHLRT